MNRTELAKAKAQLVWDILDYNCTESQADYLNNRYTYKQLKGILGDISYSDWNGRKERAFLGALNKH